MNPRYELVTVARSGERFKSFAPYVPAVDDRARVYFQARDHFGASAVYVHEHDRQARISAVGHQVISHAAVCGDHLSYFVQGALCSAKEGETVCELPMAVGPLGPTMNRSGAVAFRASTSEGEALFVARNQRAVRIASGAEGFSGFGGLPVINALGHVAFFARREEGEGIFVWQEGTISLRAFGHRIRQFPTINAAGDVLYCCESGVFLSRGDSTLAIDSPFGQLRGALFVPGGVVSYGSRAGCQTLAIFDGAHALLAVGDSYEGRCISALALNPVSVNENGDLAIRLELGEAEAIVLARRY